MSTQTRFERLQSHARALNKKLARPAPQREKTIGRPPIAWAYSADGIFGVVMAVTRSEARAEIKRTHGLKRLPADIAIDPTDND